MKFTAIATCLLLSACGNDADELAAIEQRLATMIKAEYEINASAREQLRNELVNAYRADIHALCVDANLAGVTCNRVSPE